MQYRGLLYVGILWGLTFGNWLASRIKGRTLLIEKTRQGLGAKP